MPNHDFLVFFFKEGSVTVYSQSLEDMNAPANSH